MTPSETISKEQWIYTDVEERAKNNPDKGYRFDNCDIIMDAPRRIRAVCCEYHGVGSGLMAKDETIDNAIFYECRIHTTQLTIEGEKQYPNLGFCNRVHYAKLSYSESHTGCRACSWSEACSKGEIVLSVTAPEDACSSWGRPSDHYKCKVCGIRNTCAYKADATRDPLLNAKIPVAYCGTSPETLATVPEKHQPCMVKKCPNRGTHDARIGKPAIGGFLCDEHWQRLNSGPKVSKKLDLNFDSIRATRSRGYPVFDGVPEPVESRPAAEPSFTDKVLNEVYSTSSDNAGAAKLGIQRMREDLMRLHSVDGKKERIKVLQAEVEELERNTDCGGPSFLYDWLRRPMGGKE